MYLIDNVHLKTALRGPVSHFLTDFTDIVHTVVGGRVDLNDIHGSPCLNGPTGRTFVAGTSIHRMLTIDRFCQNLCHRSLTGTPGTAEKIGVAKAVCAHLIFQCFNNMILPFNLIKG